MTADAAETLGGQLAVAEAALQRLSNGAAVCTFTKAGIAVPGLKYAEGRWAALRELQRSSAFPADPHATLDTVAAAWAADLDRRQVRGAGPDWIAYRTGGLDALADLAVGLSLRPRD
ncbi:MAG TPA: hypothetical protein VK903_12935 [Propionicimonas sp.]|nr:hypothetical protein [Propionicimonas sp.]